jgi:hypothetical protein
MASPRLAYIQALPTRNICASSTVQVVHITLVAPAVLDTSAAGTKAVPGSSKARRLGNAAL